MRPNCLFCNQPLTLVRKGHKLWNESFQNWLCLNHPAVDYVLTRFRYKSQSARSGGEDGERVYGQYYIQNGTFVYWTEGDRQYEAGFQRYQDSVHPNRTEDSGFRVYKVLKPGEQMSYRQREVMVLEKHPTNMTPENMAHKVKTYVVFS